MLPRRIKSKFFDFLSNTTGRYVKPTPYHKSTGVAAEVYQQVAEEFFINGPTTTHAVSTPLLAGAWMAEREIMLTDDTLTREDKEALGVTFSQINGCSYCEDLINSVVYGANEHELAENMRHRRHSLITDEKTRKLHQWVQASYSPGAHIIKNPPFDEREAPEVIGSALMFNYFNRYVKVFFSGTPLKSPFSSKTIKTALYRLTGVELRESVTRRLKPGRALHLLPPAPLAEDMQWATGNANIAAAVSRWTAAINEAATGVVSTMVRDTLIGVLEGWRGEDVGLGRSWLEAHTQGLDDKERAAVRLVLLTALAPTQMADDIVANFKKHYPGDATLVITVAWSAFMTAKHIAGWLAEASGYHNQSAVIVPPVLLPIQETAQPQLRKAG